MNKSRLATLVRWLKFNAVGAAGIVLQLAVLLALKSGLHVSYLMATALAVEAAVVHNFFWHERFASTVAFQRDYWAGVDCRQFSDDGHPGGSGWAELYGSKCNCDRGVLAFQFRG